MPNNDAQTESRMREILGPSWKAPIAQENARAFFAKNEAVIDDDGIPFITRAPAGWLIVASLNGRDHSGCREDGIGLAEDMARLALEEAVAQARTPPLQGFTPSARLAPGQIATVARPPRPPVVHPVVTPRPPVEEPAPPQVEEPVVAAPVVIAASGPSLADLRAAIAQHANALFRLTIDDYDRVISLAYKIVDPSTSALEVQDATNELHQHNGWAKYAKALIAARDAKLNEVNTLDEAALSGYDVSVGWPDRGGI